MQSGSLLEHAIRTLKSILGLTAAKVRAPEQADRWVRLLMAAHAQLLLARPLAAGLGTPARVAKPSRPGPGRPKGSTKGPAPRYLLPGEADIPRAVKTPLTREKV